MAGDVRLDPLWRQARACGQEKLGAGKPSHGAARDDLRRVERRDLRDLQGSEHAPARMRFLLRGGANRPDWHSDERGERGRDQQTAYGHDELLLASRAGSASNTRVASIRYLGRRHILHGWKPRNWQPWPP